MQHKSYFSVQKWIELKNGWIFKFKGSIPLYLRSHLIYKFQCSNWNITSYGETKRHLKFGAGKLIGKSPLTVKRVTNNKRSSVKDHCFCQVTCFYLRILPSWVMDHISLNVWLHNLYLLGRINHYWINKSNHGN